MDDRGWSKERRRRVRVWYSSPSHGLHKPQHDHCPVVSEWMSPMKGEGGSAPQEHMSFRHEEKLKRQGMSPRRVLPPRRLVQMMQLVLLQPRRLAPRERLVLRLWLAQLPRRL
jgi:hypothetical protein